MNSFDSVQALKQLELNSIEEGNHSSWSPWNSCCAIFNSQIYSSIPLSTLSQREVEELHIDYINNLYKDPFLMLNFDYFTQEQVEGLGYIQIDWLIEARKVATIVNKLNIFRLFYVLMLDEHNGPQHFAEISTKTLDQLLQLEEQDEAVKVHATVTELFFRIIPLKRNEVWKKHYENVYYKKVYSHHNNFYTMDVLVYKRVHRLILHFFQHQSHTEDMFTLLSDEKTLIDLFRKVKGIEQNQTLADKLSIDQIKVLIDEALNTETTSRFNRNVTNLMKVLTWDLLTATLAQATPAQAFFIISTLQTSETWSEYIQTLPSHILSHLFYLTSNSSNHEQLICAISLFRNCMDELLVGEMLEKATETSQEVNFFARKLGGAIPDLPPLHQRAIKDTVQFDFCSRKKNFDFFIEMLNGLCEVNALDIEKYMEVLSSMEELLERSDWRTQIFLYDYLIRKEVNVTGYIRYFGSPIPFLLNHPTIPPDQLRNLIGGCSNWNCTLEWKDALHRNKQNHNLLRAMSLLFPDELSSSESLPYTSCMLGATTLRYRLINLTGKSPRTVTKKWLKKLTLNAFKATSYLRESQLEVILQWLPRCEIEVFTHCLSQLESNEEIIEFSSLCFLHFDRRFFGPMIRLIESRLARSKNVGIRVIPEILATLFIRDEEGNRIEHFIETLNTQGYKAFEQLPFLYSPRPSYLSKKAAEIIDSMLQEIRAPFINENCEKEDCEGECYDFSQAFLKISIYADEIVIIQSTNFNENTNERKLYIEKNYLLILEILVPLFFIAKIWPEKPPEELTQKLKEHKDLLETCLNTYIASEETGYDINIWDYLEKHTSLDSNQLSYMGKIYIKDRQQMENYISTVGDLYQYNLFDRNILILLLNLEKFERKINRGQIQPKNS